MENTQNKAMLPTVVDKQPSSLFLTISAFEDGQRIATLLAKSKLIPANFQNNLPDCIIALELAQRIGASPMAVMQNTYVVHGKPGFSAQFVIAMVNSCGKYSPLRFDIIGDGDATTCIAWAYELRTGERLESPPVSINMAKKEGWYTKNGSKWQTMPELMLRYRAATFFGRMYAPELLMGMRTVEEIRDTPEDDIIQIDPAKELNERFPGKKQITENAPESPTVVEQPPVHVETCAEPQNVTTGQPEQEKQEEPPIPEPPPEQSAESAQPEAPPDDEPEPPPVSKQLAKLRDQLARVETELALDRWLMSSVAGRENLDGEEAEVLNKWIADRRLAVKQGE